MEEYQLEHRLSFLLDWPQPPPAADHRTVVLRRHEFRFQSYDSRET